MNLVCDFLSGLCQVVRERLLELRVQTKGLKVRKKRRLELELKLVTVWVCFRWIFHVENGKKPP